MNITRRLLILVIALSSVVDSAPSSPSQRAMAPIFGKDDPGARRGDCIVKIREGAPGLDGPIPRNTKLKKNIKIGKLKFLTVETVDDEECEEIRKDANVVYAELNNEVRVTECQEQLTTNDLWGLSRISTRLKARKIKWPSAKYSYDTTGENVDAYIVDSGVYLEHNDFGGRAVHLYTIDSLESEGDGDGLGHGTHVAGVVGGTKYGVAKGVNLWAVKVVNAQGAGTYAGVAEGLAEVLRHHNNKQSGHRSVINMSLSGPTTSTATAMNEAIEEMVLAGIPTVVSAGNHDPGENGDACTVSPALVPTAITVAASTVEDDLATFSNYGSCVDIVAPGSGIKSAGIDDPDAEKTKSGASQAVPHVTGAIALYLSTFPPGDAPTPAEVDAELENASTKDVLTRRTLRGTDNYLLYTACAS